MAAKLLFKMLPKSQNETLMKVLEMDNKFDYERNVKISANTSGTGYEILEEAQKSVNATKIQEMPVIDVTQSEDHANLSKK